MHVTYILPLIPSKFQTVAPSSLGQNEDLDPLGQRCTAVEEIAIDREAGVAADLVRPRRKSGRTKSASESGPDVAKSRGFSPGYVGLNFLL